MNVYLNDKYIEPKKGSGGGLNGVTGGDENYSNTITEQSVKAKMTLPDLMLIEIMRSVNSGDLIITLHEGIPQAIMVASRN